MAANDNTDPEITNLSALVAEYVRLYDCGAAFHRATVEHLYLQDEDFVAYDIAPPVRGYLGWKEYSVGQIKLMNKFADFHFELNDDTRIFRSGDVGWMSGSGATFGKATDGAPFRKEIRLTLVFVRRNGRWLIAQEHASAPRLFELADGSKV